jgi:hypothetical protein
MDRFVALAVWIPASPILIVCITGFVLATKRLAQHRKARSFAQIGLAAIFLRTVTAVSTQIFVMQPAETRGSAAELAGNLVVLNGATYVLMLAGVLFLAMAALANRTVTPPYVT